MQKLSEAKCFGGWIRKYGHPSRLMNCEMKVNVFIPSQAANKPVPALYFLSGLTCTEDNFFQKAGAFERAAKHGIALVGPDTSYRGVDLPGDSDTWDFGKGAGFYVDATQEPWIKHANMYSYITTELPELLKQITEIDSTRTSISGHSMGGYGVLTIALKNPGRFLSVSAFAPIVNPTQVPWGIKALGNYLGGSSAQENPEWNKYDACELVKHYTGPTLDVLIDQGTADSFLERELKPERFTEACKQNSNIIVDLRMDEGYDHSYFFIQTFIGAHLDFHAQRLTT